MVTSKEMKFLWKSLNLQKTADPYSISFPALVEFLKKKYENFSLDQEDGEGEEEEFEAADDQAAKVEEEEEEAPQEQNSDDQSWI